MFGGNKSTGIANQRSLLSLTEQPCQVGVPPLAPAGDKQPGQQQADDPTDPLSQNLFHVCPYFDGNHIPPHGPKGTGSKSSMLNPEWQVVSRAKRKWASVWRPIARRTEKPGKLDPERMPWNSRKIGARGGFRLKIACNFLGSQFDHLQFRKGDS